MKIDKSVRGLTWPDSQATGNELFHFTTHFRWPVVNGERLLCIDFQRNPLYAKNHFFTPGKDFRLVLSKREQTVRVLYQGAENIRRLYLYQLLHGFGTGPDSCYPNIQERDEVALGKWLGQKKTRNHYMPELGKWIERAIDREVLAERNARGELRDEDVELCPEELPAGMVQWIRQEVLPSDHTLLYKKGNVRGRCFRCGEMVRASSYQRFRQCSPTRCPLCGKVVIAYLETSERFKVDYVDNIATVQLGTDGKTVFFRQWHLHRDTTARWENIEGKLTEIARYAVRGDKVAKWQMEFKHSYFMNTWRECSSIWCRTQDVSRTYDGSYQFYLPPDWREQVAGTSLQYIDMETYYNSKTETLAYRNIIRFALDWARYPALEKLWKAGYEQLVHQKVAGVGKDCRGAVRWRAGNIPVATGIPLRWLKVREPGAWDLAEVKRMKQILAAASAGTIREDEIMMLYENRVPLEDIQLALGHVSVRRLLRYLKGKNAGIYRDYLRDCEKLRFDFDDLSILLPKNLNAAHQRTIEMVDYEENKEKHEAFQKQQKKLQKLCMEADGLLIRPASCINELIAEGKYLHHCVGGYADRMARGVLAIMLIRKSDEPETPYYTLEWQNNRVVQCKTMCNGDYTQNPQIQAFVERWAAWVRGGCKKKKATAVA